MEERQLSTTEDVVKKIKDDGDFDALRLKIIRVVKENEELRKNIIDQVKQSDVLNQDGSEDMKPRQLSDAIYEELGRKIMGQISDEIWKTIRLNESIKDDIKGTVERFLNKTMITKLQTSEGSIPGREANGIVKTLTTTSTPTREANTLNSNEANELSSGFGSGGGDRIAQSKNSDLQEKEQMQALIQNPSELLDQTKAKDMLLGDADDDSDLPPGFS